MTGARIFRLALRDSLPVLMGYTTMGFVAGVLLAAKGNVTLAPLWGFAYIKRFTFGGMINNKDYRLAPEKSKVLYFAAGCPEQFYVKFKPAKNQKIHQMLFEPLEMVDKGGEQRPVVELRSASARGIQLTTKPIARISPNKGPWWDEGEVATKGVLL